MTADKRDAVLARITPATEYDGLKDADIVIEAVFEDRAIKAEVTKKAEAVLPADALFASNTSTLPITGLAEAWRAETASSACISSRRSTRCRWSRSSAARRPSDATLAVAMDYRAAHHEDADRGQRLPRLLHQPRVRAPTRRGHAHAGRGRRTRR